MSVLTKEDILNWEHEIGESFLDQHGYIIDHKVYAGFLMAKEPELNLNIIEILNSNFSEAQSFEKALDVKYPERGYYKNIEYVVEFANLTVLTKERIIQALRSFE